MIIHVLWAQIKLYDKFDKNTHSVVLTMCCSTDTQVSQTVVPLPARLWDFPAEGAPCPDASVPGLTAVKPSAMAAHL